MQINLATELTDFVNQLVHCGRFPSPEAVISQGLWLLQKQDSEIEEIKKLIDVGVKDFEEGRYTAYDQEGLDKLFDEIKSEGRRKLALRKPELSKS